MTEKVTKQSLRARIKKALNRYSFFGKIEEVADKRRKGTNENCHELHQEVLLIRKELGRTGEKPPIDRLDAEALELRLQVAERKLKKERKRREFWRDRYVWARERHQHWGLVLKHRRDRLRRWIMQHDGFQPYMANGNPYEKLTAEAKHGIYLDFRAGLYVTSTYEGFPGDGVHSTGSGHYVQNQPDGKARCWDAGAASREPMAKAQVREGERAGSFMVELIGPENTWEYKNGVRYTLPEGNPLEEMHDNHKHTWVRDGAPVA